MDFTRVHLSGSHLHHFVEGQPCMRRLHLGEKHPPHTLVAVTEDPPNILHAPLTDQGHGGGLELLGKVLAALIPKHCDTLHLAVMTTAFLHS